MATDHSYVSTACFHLLHERCRKTCKFCEAKCECPCHEPAVLEETVIEREEVVQ
jgi:hypothetical protein